MVQVRVTEGNILQVPADALITAVTPYDEFNSTVNAALKQVFGVMFHRQWSNHVKHMAGIPDGHTCLATGFRNEKGPGNVIFVADLLGMPLSDIILEGLRAADHHELRRISLPTIRMGWNLGKVEDFNEAIEQIVHGIRFFINEPPRYVEEIALVVHDAPSVAHHFRQTLLLEGDAVPA